MGKYKDYVLMCGFWKDGFLHIDHLHIKLNPLQGKAYKPLLTLSQGRESHGPGFSDFHITNTFAHLHI